MDEHVRVSSGEIRRLANDIIDENRKGLAFWIEKHNGFSDREVREILATSGATGAQSIGAQAVRRRFLKKTLYGRAPRMLRAFLYWALRYFVLLGFLDGKAGFVFHFLQGFWYRLVIDAKLYEVERDRLSISADQKEKRLLRADL